ncbi:putative proline--tRNA ligase, mitochondrial [Orchesella cincta]|uniref:proline--tRNA ligase n=1 Tax=Orchesella cincta TaxID=48709 RepID=A0A1D2NKP1_ORCCI|nr:putative proline--tRNA ligase, mitochondrial [Orchesella cincta]
MKFMHCVSKTILHQQRCKVHMSSLYRPVIVAPPPSPKTASEKTKKGVRKDEQDSLSKSLRLLIDNGVIGPSSCVGAYHLLPFGLKAMEKLTKLVDNHMIMANCQKIQMPVLTSSSLWKATGRLEKCKPELMRVVDRHSKEFLLSPTHEEAICDLIKNPPLSHKQLPQRLYQITEKFRDEARPRFGLLRGRQFLMKDLYTFDTDLEAAKQTYDEINQVYSKLLSSLDLQWMQAHGSTGTIGGLNSHEFHVMSEIGEDSILQCSSCNEVFNADLSEDQQEDQLEATGSGSVSQASTTSDPKCINCGSTALSSSKCIEVAHSFLLGTKYTKPLSALYITEENKKVPMEMGCFGLGVSRLLAASVEVKSTMDEIRWPLRIAPYLVSIVPPKQGSKEDVLGTPLAVQMYESLKKILPNDVIYDDRTNQTIGKRLKDCKKLGIPYVIVCGQSVQDPLGPLMEVHDVNAGISSLDHSDKIAKQLYDINSSIKRLT